MKHLGLKGRQWLKGFHVFFACTWIGAGMSLVVMQWFMKAGDGMELYGIVRSMKFIDDFVIIPGAIGTLVTGLLFSLFTNWGFFKHWWIIVKWIINLSGVIFGTFWLGPWLNGSVPLAKELGLKALTDPVYYHNQSMNAAFGPVQVATLVIAVFISVLKPWKKRTSTDKNEKPAE